MRRLSSPLLVFAFLITLLAVGQGPDKDPKKLQMVIAKESVDFLHGDALITRYHIGATYAKPIFWPVNAPGGAELTRSWPMREAKKGESTDHKHQKSAWFCYGDVIPEGIELKHKINNVEGVDFWSEAEGHGRIVCVKSERGKAKEGGVALDTVNEWRTADDVKILDETRLISVYALESGYLIVLDIDLKASVCPITFGDTKEGAMAIRINDQIIAGKGGKGKIQNADGKTGEGQCWGQKSAWCDYSGPIGEKTVGLAILTDPKNPHASCWHSRGYGLMAANPFGRHKSGFPAVRDNKQRVRLAKGESLHLRFGLLLHEGDGQVVDRGYEQFRKLTKS